jgi:HK97 family phage prohead protease
MKGNLYNTKSFDVIKDMDSEKRQVAVYLSKFDNIDSDSDVIRRGAFSKSLMERGVNSTSNRKIAFLRHHDWQQPIGKWLTLQEDEFGLFGVGQMGNSSIANDAWEDYKMGIIREHSIGFQYIQDKIKFVEDKSLPSGGYYDITEVKLFEGSAVTFGANEMTPVVEVKSAEDKQAKLIEVSKSIENVIKSLTTGEYTDERGYALEMRLKWLQNQFMILSTSEPFDKSEHLEKKEPSIEFDWGLVVKQFTNK